MGSAPASMFPTVRASSPAPTAHCAGRVNISEADLSDPPSSCGARQASIARGLRVHRHASRLNQRMAIDKPMATPISRYRTR